MVYSDVSFEDVDKIMPADHYQQSSKAIGDDKIDVMYSYLLVVTKAFGEVLTGAEAKRLHLIVPMLAYVCELFDGDARIVAEESIVGERVHGDGKFEFVIKCGSKRLYIVVAKDNNMTQGLAQAYVGSEVLSDVEGLSTAYNIVTNYKNWCFSRIMDDRVERDHSSLDFDDNIPTKGSVKKIAEKIYAMLSEDE
ncbi:Crinkler effector protein 5 [Phytophthora oleae]|uniref:Crinkler effector protein 5 n=1 Tax=Phytophthora oleae TaxID=2107226 RepID=A0ABD3EZ85_9STRA